MRYRERSERLTIVNNNAGKRRHRPGRAAQGAAGEEDHLFLSAPGRFRVFDGLTGGRLRARARTARQPCRRIRAAGAGIGAFYTPTGYGTPLAEGKETRRIDGRDYVLEYPIYADFALIKALRGDRWGNLVYRKTARNFGPIMATAAKCAIAQVREIVNLGDLDPEAVVTPGIFVQRVVEVPAAAKLMASPGAAA